MRAKSKRVTIYLEPALHKAIRLKSAETGQSMSEIVKEALSMLLAEDAEDLAALESRINEPTVSFDQFARELKERGEI